ncbi:MAG: DUF1211 domain-containing protein [Fimbriimonadaceae bacterium]|nr:DUF1211 domain-containing protein [Fimbriimonadaceae bacterium]
MTKNRMEAFSDGVLAIVITIMVLELKVPHGADVETLKPLLPIFLSYVLSFIYIGIYWNNHHHMLHTVHHVNGKMLWANLHLLFWLSLIPFSTGWLGENHFQQLPAAVYGFNLVMCAIAYTILQSKIIKEHGPDSPLYKAVGRDWKGKASLLCYVLSIPLAFVNQWIAMAIFAIVAVIWFVPDKRIEDTLHHE